MPATRRHPAIERQIAELPKLNCGGCRKCCVGDTVDICPEYGDDHRKWKTDLLPDGRRVLKKGADGNCVYLGPKGCRTYNKRPFSCRDYDCRVHYLTVMFYNGPVGLRDRIALGMTSLEEGQRRLSPQPHTCQSEA